MTAPDALGSPGMPLVEAKRKTTLEKQRQTFEKTKDPVQKEAQAAILATITLVAPLAAVPLKIMLWRSPRGASPVIAAGDFGTGTLSPVSGARVYSTNAGSMA